MIKRLMVVLTCVTMGMLGAFLMNNNVPNRAWAGITCTLPVILQNGTTADAGQVMQNFNQLAGCFTNVATVSSVTCGPGLDGGTITGTGTCSLSAARRTNPTVSKLLSGSGSYTTPTNALWLEVTMVGGGGGGAGFTGVGLVAGSNGSDTTFSTATAGGGSGAGTGGSGGAGGAASTCTMGINGGGGGAFSAGGAVLTGGVGGSSYYGGGGRGVGTGFSGVAGEANSGGGGSGAQDGGGGGAGAYCWVLVTNPAASYSYVVGAGGAGGVAGSTGGAGASGSIYILEHYN